MKYNYLKDNFSIILNSLIEDNRLSYGAKGVACYLLSKPTNWKFYMSDIQNHSTDGRTKVQNYIKELEEIGFLKRELKRDENNKILGNEYVFDLEYCSKPVRQESRQTENPLDGKSTSNNNNINNNDNSNNKDKYLLPTAKSEEFALERVKEISMQEAEKERKKALVNARNAVFSHFCELYSNLSGGRQYLPKKSEFVLLTRLLKTYTSEEIKEKIGWLYVGCAKGLFWFAKNIGDFTLGKLYSQWNNILPHLTEEQKKEAQKQKEDEELRRRVMENVRESQSSK